LTVASLLDTAISSFRFTGNCLHICFHEIVPLVEMSKLIESQSRLMSLLTISALEKVTKDSSCWKEQIVHKALLISGLSVLITATQLLDSDLEQEPGENSKIQSLPEP